jgi:hypothetical protein
MDEQKNEETIGGFEKVKRMLGREGSDKVRNLVGTDDKTNKIRSFIKVSEEDSSDKMMFVKNILGTKSEKKVPHNEASVISNMIGTGKNKMTNFDSYFKLPQKQKLNGNKFSVSSYFKMPEQAKGNTHINEKLHNLTKSKKTEMDFSSYFKFPQQNFNFANKNQYFKQPNYTNSHFKINGILGNTSNNVVGKILNKDVFSKNITEAQNRNLEDFNILDRDLGYALAGKEGLKASDVDEQTKLTEGLETAGQLTKEGLISVGKLTAKGLSATGKGVVKGLSATGKGVAKGLSATGKGVVKGLSATGKGLTKGAKLVYKKATAPETEEEHKDRITRERQEHELRLEKIRQSGKKEKQYYDKEFFRDLRYDRRGYANPFSYSQMGQQTMNAYGGMSVGPSQQIQNVVGGQTGAGYLASVMTMKGLEPSTMSFEDKALLYSRSRGSGRSAEDKILNALGKTSLIKRTADIDTDLINQVKDTTNDIENVSKKDILMSSGRPQIIQVPVPVPTTPVPVPTYTQPSIPYSATPYVPPGVNPNVIKYGPDYAGKQVRITKAGVGVYRKRPKY